MISYAIYLPHSFRLDHLPAVLDAEQGDCYLRSPAKDDQYYPRAKLVEQIQRLRKEYVG